MKNESEKNDFNYKIFKKYMNEQIKEIEKYASKRLKEDPFLDLKSCVFEWIDKYAQNFRKNYLKKISSSSF